MNVLDYISENALVLIPVLNIIGSIIKRIERIPDNYIPLILLFFGIFGAVGIIGFSAHAVVQGVLVTGAAVYGNQLVKQLSRCPKPKECEPKETSAEESDKDHID